MTVNANELLIEAFWYPNGQLWKVESKLKNQRPRAPDQDNHTLSAPRLVNWWDSTGHQGIRDGNGRATLQQFVKSPQSDTIFCEYGAFTNSMKNGMWAGSYADGSCFYQENYVDGSCIAGKAKEPHKDTFQYEQQVYNQSTSAV